MEKAALYAWISDTLVNTFELDPADVGADARLNEDLGLDSIDAVDLIVKLQQHTGTRFAADQFKNVRTVGDVVDTVSALMQS
ncbi:acyl carrier protein [Chitinibacteraceae bacterium HSL-7]